MKIRRIESIDDPDWLEMRRALWPHSPEEQHLIEMKRWLAVPKTKCAFLAMTDNSKVAGFAEGAIREYANGCDTSPVGFIEGVYVKPEHRTEGIGRYLCHKIEEWALSQGCTEIASDAEIENYASLCYHKALGYSEVVRTVCFVKKLA